MDPIRFEYVYQLTAPPEEVWPLLADTERLNRRIGLPPTQATAVAGTPVRAARVRARLFGVSIEWEERPFEFVECEYYWVRRRMLKGPLREFNGGIRFQADGSGTRVIVRGELAPRNTVGRTLAQGVSAKSRRDFDRLIADLQRQLAEAQPLTFGKGVDTPPPGRVEAVRAALRNANPDSGGLPLFERLLDHLATASDLEANRIRPFALARQWNADRYELLRHCLRAARQGVLDLSWDLVCPNCRGAQSRWHRLEEVQERGHCSDCQISFGANFDRAMEVTFRPNPRIRVVAPEVYCSGGPRNTPHIVAQAVLEPGERWEARLPLHAGRYRVRNLTGDLAAWLFADEDEAPAELVVCLEEDALHLAPGGGVVGAGLTPCRVENRTESLQQFILERFAYYDEVATAANVTVFQEFRDLFSREVLSPAVRLGIQTLPLMFTDLKGSTMLYSRLGDASAYALVRDHFILLQKEVAAHGGGLVKTIGDAVMAAFPTARDALTCALDIHRDLQEFNAGLREPLRLKIGLHQGACIAAASYDDRLDYFGSTVNLAARTHEESRGDDIVVTREIVADPAVRELLEPLRKEEYCAELRGIGPVDLIRLYP